MIYRPEIDGLRAVAVLPVVFFHAGFETFKGGFVGVDIFFVISGYLISSIIATELKNGTFSLQGFYQRRIRRILPALFAVVIVSVPFAWYLMLPEELEEFFSSVLSVPLFASNIFFFLQDNYFNPMVETKPLLHTWSLAVEEQFYIFFPVLMILLYRLRKNALIYIIAVVSLLSLLSAEFLWHQYQFSSFYLTPMRVWELFVGVLITLVVGAHKQPKGYLSEFMSVLGLLLILASVFLFGKTTHFPSIYALVPTIGAALIIVFSHSDTYVSKLLKSKILVGVGLISYSLYLWHQPVFAFAKLYANTAVPFIILLLLCVVSLLVGFLSWKYIEQPFRRKKNIPTTNRLFIFAFLTSILIISLGLIGKSGWISSRYDKEFSYLDEVESRYGGSGYRFGVNQLGDKAFPPSFIVYGDSHAQQYLVALEEFSILNKLSFLSITKPACLALPNVTNYWNNQVRKDCIAQFDVLKSEAFDKSMPIFISYRWVKPLVVNGSQVINATIVEPEGREVVFAALNNILDIPSYSGNIVVIGNVPTTNLLAEGGYKKCIFKGYVNCPVDFSESKGEAHSLINEFQDFANKNKRVFFINPYEAVCESNRCKVIEDNKLLYSDHAHLSKYGATLVVNKYKLMILDFIKKD